jgi:hypothetical protein
MLNLKMTPPLPFIVTRAKRVSILSLLLQPTSPLTSAARFQAASLLDRAALLQIMPAAITGIAPAKLPKKLPLTSRLGRKDTLPTPMWGMIHHCKCFHSSVTPHFFVNAGTVEAAAVPEPYAFW